MLSRSLIVCAGIAWAGTALAAPKSGKPPPAKAGQPASSNVDPRKQEKLAGELRARGEHKQALDVIEEGLEAAPQDRELLYLQCVVLFQLEDHARTLTACESFVTVSPDNAKREDAKRIVTVLKERMQTFLEITVANGPADVYLQRVAAGRLFCKAAPSCKGELAPGEHRVIIDRAGFARWTERVTVPSGKTEQVNVTLVEKPSLLTVNVAPPGASVAVDGAAYDKPISIAPGKHAVVVSLKDHAGERIEVLAREGKPIDLDLELAPIVPLRVEPPASGLELLLDDKLVQIQDGGIAVHGGARELRVSAPGFHGERIKIPAERGADYRIAVQLRRLPPPLAPARGVLTGRRKVALAAGAVGLVAVSSAVLLGLQANQLESDALALCPSPGTPCLQAERAEELNTRAQARALHANVAFGIAGGAAITAAILWLTGASESPVPGARRPSVSVTPHLGAAAGLDLSFRF